MSNPHEHEHAPEVARPESLSSLSTDSDSTHSGRRSRFGSIASSLRARSSSRPRSTEIRRIYSGRHLDDHSVYHGEDDSIGMSQDDVDEKDVNAALEVRDGIVNERDLDLEANRAGPTDLEKSQTAGSRPTPDPKLVTWNGPDDPDNPKNWPMRRKWSIVLMVSCFTFISPVSSSMVAPALTSLAKDLHITDAVESQLTLSVFVLAYAVGPLFLGPLSEIYGRVIILQLANLFYLVFNIACGVSQTKAQMIVFRFFAGLGGSAPLAVGGAVLSDCFKPEERGKSIAIYSLAPLLGPARLWWRRPLHLLGKIYTLQMRSSRSSRYRSLSWTKTVGSS
ncbi:major facilitator superfamily domain-containing protein [Aspergillus pseudodeflectus]|uniref:Major facilitator superfamily domain-containing protein n=1 Tax=Aspergillus pseudodeflectus TaxID=176178 RepID=A0ABR4JDT9_9EURO